MYTAAVDMYQPRGLPRQPPGFYHAQNAVGAPSNIAMFNTYTPHANAHSNPAAGVLPYSYAPPNAYPPHAHPVHHPHAINAHINTHALPNSSSPNRIVSTSPVSPILSHAPHALPSNSYRTHHIEHPHAIQHPPIAHPAISEQLNRLKAATACQIINQRVVEALKDQEKKRREVARRRVKQVAQYGDPNETNPNNPAYIGAINAKARKMERLRKKHQKRLLEESCQWQAKYAEALNDDDESDELGPTMPQRRPEPPSGPSQDVREVPIFSNNINVILQTPGVDGERDSMLSPAMSPALNGHHRRSPYFCKSDRFETPPPKPKSAKTPKKRTLLVPLGPPKPNPLEAYTFSPSSSRRTPKRKSPGKGHANMRTEESPRVQNRVLRRAPPPPPNPMPSPIEHPEEEEEGTADVSAPSEGNDKEGLSEHSKLDDGSKDIASENLSSVAKAKKKNVQIAPAHANVQSVISPNGGIYHPCHGYSTRDISIFDLFPGIVKYQSKKYNEADRVQFLTSLSQMAFVGVNNRPLKVDEAEMWFMALKYLFNDITLGQFDYMTVEMRYVIKQYMTGHKNRQTFLNSINTYGFLRVISDVSKKLPKQHIRKIMQHERVKKQKRKMQLLQQNEKLKAENARKLYGHQLLVQHHQRHAQAQAAEAQVGQAQAQAVQVQQVQVAQIAQAARMAGMDPYAPPYHMRTAPVIVDAEVEAEMASPDWDHVIAEIVKPELDELDLDVDDMDDIPDLPVEDNSSSSKRRPMPLPLNLFTGIESGSFEMDMESGAEMKELVPTSKRVKVTKRMTKKRAEKWVKKEKERLKDDNVYNMMIDAMSEAKKSSTRTAATATGSNSKSKSPDTIRCVCVNEEPSLEQPQSQPQPQIVEADFVSSEQRDLATSMPKV